MLRAFQPGLNQPAQPAMSSTVAGVSEESTNIWKLQVCQTGKDRKHDGESSVVLYLV